MRRLVLLMVALCLVTLTLPAFAAEGGGKGASTAAYEHASDQSIFNRVSDWFATVGKSSEEKQKILAERKAKRAAQRAQKKAQKSKKELKAYQGKAKKESKPVRDEATQQKKKLQVDTSQQKPTSELKTTTQKSLSPITEDAQKKKLSPNK